MVMQAQHRDRVSLKYASQCPSRSPRTDLAGESSCTSPWMLWVQSSTWTSTESSSRLPICTKTTSRVTVAAVRRGAEYGSILLHLHAMRLLSD